ncbi:MAG: DUF72 domain-containing protein [Sphingomonadales bacterium]|nr:DUF72 domain-containing protein [Sphingomonadales bacterium]
MSGTIRIGIGGWTYKPWRGSFYPGDLPQKRELEYAAGKFGAIEISGTYYRLQKPASFAKWRDAAPEGFQYSVKASRYCTNRKDLTEGGEGIGNFFGQGIEELGDRLGPVLWQFMGHKPRERGAGIVVADHADYPQIADLTADFVYARLQQAEKDIGTGYREDALDDWAAACRSWAAGDAPRGLDYACPREPAAGGRDVYCFMINGAKIRAPAAAEALQARID